MAVKRPIVYSSGELEVLQDGDRVFGPSAVQVFNSTGTVLPIATPVYLSGADEVRLARSDDPLTKTVFGLVIDLPIDPHSSGYVARDGVITATPEQWLVITGHSGLIPLQKYYLSATNAGKLVTSPPIIDGNFICPVGVAKNETDMGITILSTIKL